MVERLSYAHKGREEGLCTVQGWPLFVLDGIRVVEIGGLAGAYCGKLLADMGADVLRIDDLSYDVDAEALGELNYYHRSKKRQRLDSAKNTSHREYQALLAEADVLIDAQTHPEFDHTKVRERHPRLVVVAIRPFGNTGPWSHFRGSDLVCQAAGGMLLLNGDPGRVPLQMTGLQAYHAASLQAAIGIALALLSRARHGRGQEIDVSIQEAVAACVEHATSRFQDDGHVEQRRGSLHGGGQFCHARCRDGYVLLSSCGDWPTLLEWLKGEDAAQDLTAPEWQAEAHRREHCEHLFDVLARWAAAYSVQDLVEAAQRRRLPFAPVLSMEELLRHPQLRARQFFLESATADAESRHRVLEPGPPLRFLGSPGQVQAEQTADKQGTSHRTIYEGGNSRGISGQEPLRCLDGLRVLDLTWVVAGPLATRVLADHGAEVLHIERTDTPPRDAWGRRLQQGKKSLALNLNHPRGLDILRRLIAQSDVVIDNFSPRVMHNWGLSYPSLCELRSDIIAVSMSGFGQDGPWRDYVSYAPTLQALAGFSDSMRYAGGAPIGCGFSYSDVVAGWMAAWATLLAVWQRQRSSTGQHIDLSQLECLATLLGPEIRRVSREASQRGFRRASTAIDNSSQEMPSAPHGVYACADLSDRSPKERWCAIAVFREEEWTAFCAALGHPAWAGEERFHGLAGRLRHRAELDAHIAMWTRKRAAEDVMAHLQSHGIAAAVVADAFDVCAGQQLPATLSVAALNPGIEGLRMAPRLSVGLGRTDAPAPRVGEHTDEILNYALGMSPREITELREAGMII